MFLYFLSIWFFFEDLLKAAFHQTSRELMVVEAVWQAVFTYKRYGTFSIMGILFLKIYQNCENSIGKSRANSIADVRNWWTFTPHSWEISETAFRRRNLVIFPSLSKCKFWYNFVLFQGCEKISDIDKTMLMRHSVCNCKLWIF